MRQSGPYTSQRNLGHHQVQVACQGAEEHHTLNTGSRGGRKPGRAGGHAHGTDDPGDHGKDINRVVSEATLAVPSPGAEEVAQGVEGGGGRDEQQGG